MRGKKPYQVLTFHTTDAAMEMESFCKQNGIAGRLVPVPRRLSAGCGIAWRMEAERFTRSIRRLSRTVGLSDRAERGVCVLEVQQPESKAA